MADPLDAYNREIQRRSGPLGLTPAETRGGALLQSPLYAVEGLGELSNFLLDAPSQMGEAALNYLAGPSKFARDVRSGVIPESEIPAGVDLVDLLGDMDPNLGAPDFLPDDYTAGEIFSYDPTGMGLTKSSAPPIPLADIGQSDADEIEAYLNSIGITPPRFADEETVMSQRVVPPSGEEIVMSQPVKAEDITPDRVQEQLEPAFKAAMDDYIQQVRGSGPNVKTPKDLEEYKKEFAEATGINISGKPDKSSALMAFGLALMQNKAGKGFNVGKMLSSVGEAGTAALPALEKAKQQARQDGIAAGKYALEMRSADEAKAAAAREKAMARENYYVVPRSEDVTGFLAGIGEGKGRLESLSKYEGDKLLKNPEFASKFDILPGSTWGTVVEEALKTPEGKDLYLDKKVEIPLFEGAQDDLFKIRVYDPDPNSNPNGQPIMAGNGQGQYEALARMARDTEKAKGKFVELGVLNEGTSIYRYTVDSLNSLGSAFGLQFGNEVPETQRMKMVLEKMQAKNAPAILGEAGKTISDADRARVAAIVGTIGPTTDPRELEAKFQGLFNDIILGAERDIQQGLSTLNRYTGRSIGDAIGSGDLNEDEQAELLAGLKALGVN